jgi:hypothetical protein
MSFIRAAVKLVKSTHRHPANIALHAAGMPLYGAGIATIVMAAAGHAGLNVLAGAALIPVAIGMFVAGHAIEGNVMSMTPVLLARLAWRFFFYSLQGRKHPGKDRVHLLRR